MSYVSVDAPLPRNGRSQVPQCEIDAARAQVQDVEASVANAKAASSQIATPQSFAGLGQGVQRDVQRSQNELIAAQRFRQAPMKDSMQAAIRNAPQVLPLNVPVAEYSGCSVRAIGPVSPLVVSQDQQRVVMPPPAPTDTYLLAPQNAGMTTAPVSAGPFGPPLPQERQMKYMGFAGMSGVAWGDAIADPRALGNGNQAGLSGKMLFWLALGGVGLYAVTRKGRR